MEKGPAPKKRILVVDDEPDILKLIEWQLMMGGYDVITANTGGEGLEKAKNEKPDLIILDVIMPIREMNGVQMNERLKEDPETKHIPVIFFTSSIDPGESVEGEEGTVMFPKTVSSEKLMNKIRELTGR